MHVKAQWAWVSAVALLAACSSFSPVDDGQPWEPGPSREPPDGASSGSGGHASSGGSGGTSSSGGASSSGASGASSGTNAGDPSLDRAPLGCAPVSAQGWLEGQSAWSVLDLAAGREVSRCRGAESVGMALLTGPDAGQPREAYGVRAGDYPGVLELQFVVEHAVVGVDEADAAAGWLIHVGAERNSFLRVGPNANGQVQLIQEISEVGASAPRPIVQSIGGPQLPYRVRWRIEPSEGRWRTRVELQDRTQRWVHEALIDSDAVSWIPALMVQRAPASAQAPALHVSGVELSSP